MIDNCYINKLAKNQVSAVFHSHGLHRSVTQIYSGAPAARRAAKRIPILIWETKGNP